MVLDGVTFRNTPGQRSQAMSFDFINTVKLKNLRFENYNGSVATLQPLMTFGLMETSTVEIDGIYMDD